MLVGELADRDPGLVIGEREAVTGLFGRPAFPHGGRVAVVEMRPAIGPVSPRRAE
jgi:hypothetical protein